MAQGFGLARTGFADDDVPRQLVEVLAAALVFLEPFLEFLPQLVQLGAAVGIADRLWRRCCLRLDGCGKPFALPPCALAPPEIITTKKEGGENQDHHDNPDTIRVVNDAPSGDRAQSERAQPPFDHALNS